MTDKDKIYLGKDAFGDKKDPRIDPRNFFVRCHHALQEGRGLTNLGIGMAIQPLILAMFPIGGMVSLFVNKVLEVMYLDRKEQAISAPFCMPQHLKYRDGSLEAIGKKYLKESDLPKLWGQGSTYLGFDLERKMQFWVSDDELTTHVGMVGTTKSGKTTLILSLCANALMKGGGFIYADAKGDIQFQRQAQMIARYVGREDDYLTLSFTPYNDTGYGDKKKPTNTFNLMGTAGASEISELIQSLLPQGENDVWSGRARAFIPALIRPLVYLRDRYNIPLSPNTLLSYLELGKLIQLAFANYQDDKGFVKSAGGLKDFLRSLTNFNEDVNASQHEKTHEQMSYITMQLTESLSDLGYNYGHIFGVEIGEVSMTDVVFNRRILTCLLPALGRSLATLNMLGRLIISSVKQMMSLSLGSEIEGSIRLVVDARPTEARNIFLICYDEVGYMMTEGMSVQPAQGRSLRLSFSFGAQSYSNLEKGSQIEAEEIWDNLNIKFIGRVTGGSDSSTFGKVSGLVNDVYQLIQTGVEIGAIGYSNRGTYEYRKDKAVEIGDLAGQASGEFTAFVVRKSEGGKRWCDSPIRFRTLFPAWEGVKETDRLILNDFVPLNMQNYEAPLSKEKRIENGTDLAQALAGVSENTIRLPEHNPFLAKFVGRTRFNTSDKDSVDENGKPISTEFNDRSEYYSNEVNRIALMCRSTKSNVNNKGEMCFIGLSGSLATKKDKPINIASNTVVNHNGVNFDGFSEIISKKIQGLGIDVATTDSLMVSTPANVTEQEIFAIDKIQYNVNKQERSFTAVDDEFETW